MRPLLRAGLASGVPMNDDDWTVGYRKAWFYVRSGVAWWFVEKALRVFPNNDPARAIFAAAVLEMVKASRT